MGWLEYTVLAFTTLFVIVDPIAVVPAFLAMTPEQTPEARLRTARIACSVAAAVLVVFTLLGESIFRYLHVSPGAFQIAGSILLLRIALDMLHGQRSAAQETNEEVLAGAAKEDIAVSPLAVPMLAGPGAISTSLILFHQAESVWQRVTLFLVIGLVAIASYGIFTLAIYGIHRVSPLALKLINRLMGLLLAAVAVQFALDGVAQVGWCRT
ncbi:MAG: MarC family protein [Candidatus Binatia bacterium]|nr:MarC family protein [Candidatus Binatia bacterium]